MRRILLVAVLVLALRLPFLNQAIQGDDVYYLAGAQYAQIDPLHPNHARYVFLGQEVDMRGHPHPPLNAWFLGLLLAVWGDIREAPYHGAYILFSLIAALSMLSLAERFSKRPLFALLLFLCVPAFVVNGNSLESDIPFLAFWMASAACWVRAVEAGSGRWLAAAIPSMALASMAAFQALVLVPVLGWYVWLKRRGWRAAWVALWTPVAVIAGWQVFERLSTGALPAEVLAGYFQSYGLQTLTNKLKNAVALTVHLGWTVFPLLGVAALGAMSWRRGRWKGVLWPAGAAMLASAAGAFYDASPLFWAPLGVGVFLLAACLAGWREEPFLAGWLLIFFTAAVGLFFAGSARYLLPLAAPLAMLAANHAGKRMLSAGIVIQAVLSVSLAVVNYEHWDGYRAFVASIREEFRQRRVWINGEWGLRFYAEAEGGLALRQGQAVQPGEVVITSRLAYPISFTTGGGTLAPLAEMNIEASLPVRLIGLNSKSAYSTAALGLRAFDAGVGPIDVVRAASVIERKPTREYLPMGAPEAAWQIVSGLYEPEGGGWRWMGERAVILLKAPWQAMPLAARFRLLEQSGRKVELWMDGRLAASQTYRGPGDYELRSPPLKPSGQTATLTITIDRTFQAPGDRRRLGMILTAAGFRP